MAYVCQRLLILQILQTGFLVNGVSINVTCLY